MSSSEVIDWVAANARPLRIVGALNTYPQFKHLEPNPKRADALIAPLLFGREVLGTICINSSRLNRFGPEALALLVSIAEVIAAALHRERIGRIREHHERLAVMGQLAATVAHELSNPLTVLMAAVDAMGELVDRMPMGAPGTAETQRTVVDARDAVNRMATLISEIKGAVRKPEAERQRLDLTAAAQRAATLVEADLRHRARLTIEHTGPQWVSADPSRIGQVLVNLIINASHALTGYGHITLRTRRGGAWSVIEVEDNGCGMPADVAARVFEPFFTTKPLGTGLGLSICKQIALDYGGKLTFETRIGSGTRFMLQLPAVEAVEEEKPVLLLVDDDELLLRAVGRVLSTKFRVLEASGPQEALALAASAPVQLVLTDFSMPIHNGLWLIRALRDRGIAAPAALLTAARASQEIEAALHSGLIVRVFTKPTNLMALAVEARALVRC